MRGPYGKLWTESFPSFYGPSAMRVGHENKEGKKTGSITFRLRTEQTRLIRCLLYGFVDYSGKGTTSFRRFDRACGPYGYRYGPEINQSQHAKSVSHIITCLIANSWFLIYRIHNGAQTRATKSRLDRLLLRDRLHEHGLAANPG